MDKLELINCDLDRDDVMSLVKGTGGPGRYVHPFEMVGGLYGFPNERWQWNDVVLKQMTTADLFNLYKRLKEFNSKQ